MAELPPLEMTDDAFLGGALRILQPKRGFRAGSDAVLLAASLPARPAARVLDAGAGVGVVALAAARRLAEVRFEGLEIEPDLVALAGENARRNGLDHCVTFTEGDLLARAGKGAHDLVVSNPPFHDARESPPAPDPGRARARHGASLAAWIGACLARLADGGELRLILPSARLGEALAALDPAAGRIVVFPLHSRAGRDAKRVIVAARKGARAPLRLAAGLVLHGAGRAYGEAAEAVLRHGGGLDLEADRA